MNKEELRQLIEGFDAITKESKQVFGALNAQQLNWKPAPDTWSIGQVFDHLITSNSLYYSGLDKIIAGSKTKAFWESLPFLPKLWGSWLKKSMLPDSKSKFKSPKVFRPSASDIRATIIRDFVDHQQRLINRIRKTETLDHAKIMFTSPVASIITYSLEDTFFILLHHEQRHLQQAKRIKALEAFPQT